MKRWLWSLRFRKLPRDETARLLKARGKRVLIHEILSLQILITAVIGVLAIAGLYVGKVRYCRRDTSRWALQWTEELHELGAPFYLPGDGEVTLRIESYIERYPEIERVTYFRLDGSEIESLPQDSGAGDAQVDVLPDETIEQVANLAGNATPYLLKTSILESRAFEIYAPIWTESIANDGLFDFDPASDNQNSSMDLVGYMN
ncbi:MAG: hypothetical protein U5K38_07650 [Woeseiaceae bacterium]|nr:hypothetical protein [Woeseiaceae bacterium]